MRRAQIPGPMALAALGVVFGDIGTSPLYTLTTCYTTAKALPTLANTLGIISLLIWALIVVACIKYVTVLLRVDHDGEGGILALLALASPPRLLGKIGHSRWLITVVVIAAAMLIGDGMITPAISVISAVEGLGVATTSAQPFIVPISVGVLLALFLIQSRGTQSVGNLFGPVMLVWFAAIALLGLIAVVKNPVILFALNPGHALWFVFHHGVYGFLIFGGIILALTGAEALYADLSHFGRIPITWAWYGSVFPSLVLNYLGQGANLVSNPKALDSPFYALSGGWTLMPMVVLATAATVIASQGLISGAFTLTQQGIALNLCPRMLVVHTSKSERGQVYVPFINVVLAVVCLLLVVTFRSSARLAAAYGLAVACTMLGTTIAFFVVATKVFHWPKRYVVPGISLFVLIDTLFVTSGLPKFLDGAWVPLAVSAVVATISLTWLRGRRALSRALTTDEVPIADYVEQHGQTTTPIGTSVLLTGDPTGIPFIRRHRWLPNFLDRKIVVLLNLLPADIPYVEEADRVAIDRPAPALFVVRASFGYMEPPRLEPVLLACGNQKLTLNDEHTTFFYAQPVIIGKAEGGMKRGQRALFMWLSRVSRSLVDDLELPPDRRVGLGVEIQI